MSGGWQLVLYAHLLAMAFFVGGQLVVAVAVVPALRSAGDRERLRAVARRFGIGSAVALAVLLASGAALATHYDLWESGTLHAKLALFALALALVAAHLRWPRAHPLQGAVFVVSLVIVWLGLELPV